MTRTGPQKIPGANQSNFYGGGTFSGSDMEVNCGVIHTTEGRTLPTYADSQGRRGAMAPTVTGVPDFQARKIRWYQHYDVDESARALANKLGGVETNTANAFQVELVGTCDDRYAKTWGSAKAGVDYLHWPTAPEWALAEVAWLVRWLNANHGIPLTCVKDWLAYGKDSRRPGITPASYGTSPARMSMSAWRAFKGWCGHQHVPENDHGDPGSMNFARVIALAKADQDDEPTTPTKPTQPNTPKPPAFPGKQYFRPGADNAHVTQLGKQLVKKGYGRFYTVGPGPRWGEADRRAVEAFQRAQGWTGSDADGYPGPETWRRLFS
ncbi:peptidoglycan-binding protein [Streptomyces sp. NPDC091281]|uniref:peptidoglycan-binding protein n=1 Tax=Streptomyces sp. NPDC091281 TaxID=3365985 RepID=UPI00381D315A